eukprot:scaffold40211_cov36-Phaeocystis_antarctica.AAC.1
MPGSNVQAWQGLTEGQFRVAPTGACYARLEDRPLGVWVGEGLKEEIAGERGPRRPSQRPHDAKSWSTFFESTSYRAAARCVDASESS